MALGSLIGLVISNIVGSFAVLSVSYMGVFLNNLHVPYLNLTTVDRGLDVPNPPRLVSSPLYNNILLLLGFGLQHSGMVRGPVRRLAKLVFSDDGFRVFYMAVTSVYVIGALYLWAPMPYPLWDFPHEIPRFILIGLNTLSGCGAVFSIFSLDPFRLAGIRPYFDQVFNKENFEMHFVTTGLYGLMRHPMYSFMILGFWITPTMTVGHLLFAVVFTGYILFAVAQYEEPDLVKTIGPRYEEYQRTTPQYIPTLSSLRAAMGARMKIN